MSEEEVKKSKKVEGLTREAKVTVIATSNPKREGSAAHERFEHYFKLKKNATVQDAIDAGLTIGDIRFDTIAGSISVEGATVVEYEVTPRGSSGGEAAEADAEGADSF